MYTIVIISIVIALAFDFLNGMNDAANSIATIVSTRVLTPLLAVLWAAFFNFSAAFFFGTHVAGTIGKGIVNPDVNPELINQYFILSALIGAIIWVYICTKFGIPISVSHALIGGLIGPALFFCPQSLVISGIVKVALFIILSPLIGMILGYFIMIITMLIFRRVAPIKIDHFFRYMQLLSSAIFSLGHGGNDAQKTMGIITVLLYTSGVWSDAGTPPTWVIYTCYITISLGTLTGGWKVIRTLGNGLTDLKPVQGFCAETAGAFTLIGTALFGIPVSTTHTITGSIVGVGVTRRFSAVRWGTASNIVAAWVLTIPASMIVSALVYCIIHCFIG
jgi:PiT family inorganic phosphate transporter